MFAMISVESLVLRIGGARDFEPIEAVMVRTRPGCEDQLE